MYRLISPIACGCGYPGLLLHLPLRRIRVRRFDRMDPVLPTGQVPREEF